MQSGTLATSLNKPWKEPFPKSPESHKDRDSQQSKKQIIDESGAVIEVVGSKDEYGKIEIPKFPVKYKGEITRESLRSCQLVARKLGDIYDSDKNKLTSTTNIRHDYFGIISKEQERGRTLIAFDQDWILPILVKFVQTDKINEIHRPEILRSTIAKYNPITSLDVPYALAATRTLPPKIALSEENISVYTFSDPDVGNIRDQVQQNYYDQFVQMIFAPVDADLAEAIFMYLYQQKNYYSAEHYFSVNNVSPDIARDFEYLFPVELKFVQNIAIFSSIEMNRYEMIQAFYRDEVSRKFPRINPLLGAFATFLLAEATSYDCPLTWENLTLTVKHTGYIQAQDLFEQFGRIISEIMSEKIKYHKLLDYQSAATISQNSDVKCFPFEGYYYAVIPFDQNLNVNTDTSLQEYSLVETFGPLRSMERFPQETGKYLTSLGYQISKEPHTNDIKLRYRTYLVNGKKVTIYYYLTSTKQEMKIHESDGAWSKDLLGRLTMLLQNGNFFSSRAKSLIQRYPGFIPNDPPTVPELSAYPEKALYQIDEQFKIDF